MIIMLCSTIIIIVRLAPIVNARCAYIDNNSCMSVCPKIIVVIVDTHSIVIGYLCYVHVSNNSCASNKNNSCAFNSNNRCGLHTHQ
jgi:hypothetical protein